MILSLSVIIPSYNGATRIIRCLKSLIIQKECIKEIIIVVDGSTDNTISIIQQFFSKEIIRIIEQTNKGRSGARNTGARAANGSILLFVDDDMELSERVIFNHLIHHIEFKQSILIGGQFINCNANSDFMCYRSYIEGSWYDQLPDYPIPLSIQALFVTAAHLSISKDLFDQLEGFDESLRDTEDLELGLRALEKKVNIYFNKKLIGRHNDECTCKNYIKRRREYEQANTQLLRVSDRYRLFRKVKDDYCLLKVVIYRLLAFKFWIRLIDAEKLTWLPKSFRYRFYSAVIWSLGKYHTEINLD